MKTHSIIQGNLNTLERGEDLMYTVLLVDDEPLVLEGLRFMINWESYGFRVCGEASDGEEALERIQELNPDLVVTDISMPIMDGLQLIEYSKQVLNTKGHFFILSGYDDFTFARKALTYGVFNYWLKPIDVEEIHTSLLKLHIEWSHRDYGEIVSSQSTNSNLGAIWNIPEVVDPLFEAEDRLLLAIINGNGAAIDEAAQLLCRQLELSFADDNKGSKVFLSNVLLELSWKVLEGQRTFPDEEGKRGLPLPMLPNSLDRWLDVLTTFAHKVAEQLAWQRSVNGTAWEAARLIRERYHEPLQLQTIARILHFQPAYLGQLFKKQMGMSFLDYVHRTRVEEGRKLLRREDMKIADVARAVGYTDPEQFASKFKQLIKMTPSQYRNSQF